MRWHCWINGRHFFVNAATLMDAEWASTGIVAQFGITTVVSKEIYRVLNAEGQPDTTHSSTVSAGPRGYAVRGYREAGAFATTRTREPLLDSIASAEAHQKTPRPATISELRASAGIRIRPNTQILRRIRQ